MDIQSIAFTGDRESGEDIAFVSDFDAVVRADLGTGLTRPYDQIRHYPRVRTAKSASGWTRMMPYPTWS